MAATKNQKNDPSRFEGNGTNFRAKLIGVDNVEEARGDKICQVSMQKLKALVKASGEHKQKIVVNVSLEGLKIIDGVSLAVLYTHPVHRISFIARDMSDNRAFGYIFGAGDGTHQFFAIKTEKAAENLVLTLRDLFEVVYDMKKKEMEEAKKKQEESTTENGETGSGEKDGQKPGEEGQESIYQDPPKSDSPEHIYAVPHNNAPVNPESEKSESNLLDLEDQLESIELGIQQMSSFDSLVGGASAGGQTTTDPWGTPVSSAASSSGSGLSDLQGLQSGFAAPSPFQQPGFGAAAPFGAARPAVPGMTAPAGNPFAPQVGVPPNTNKTLPTQPTTGLPFTPDPFANDPFSTSQVRTPFPAASAGFGTAPPAAFPQPTPGVQPGFGTPATSFGQPAAAFPAVPAAVPIPGASPFPGVPPQTGPVQANFAGFPEEDPNILAPVVIGKEEAPAEPKPEKEKKDAFSDLVAIGTTTDVRKTPKDMFAELNAPPKKTLIELQMEKNSALTPGTASPNRSPSPLIVPQASDPFGPLSKAMDGIQNLAASAADPFDTSHVHFSPPLLQTSDKSSITASQTLQSNLPITPTVKPDSHNVNHVPPATTATKVATATTATTTAANHNKILPEKNTLRLPNGTVPTIADDFQLPSPEDSPPPLPNTVRLSFPNSAPAPPPRPKYTMDTSSMRPRPVPKPRKAVSTSDCDKNVFPTSASDPFLAPPSEANTVHNAKDPFLSFASNNNNNNNNNNTSAFPTSTSDPFLALTNKLTNSAHNDTDPFLSNNVIQSDSSDKWKAFGDFGSDPFSNETTDFTSNVVKKVSAGNETSPFGDPFAAPGENKFN